MPQNPAEPDYSTCLLCLKIMTVKPTRPLHPFCFKISFILFPEIIHMILHMCTYTENILITCKIRLPIYNPYK